MPDELLEEVRGLRFDIQNLAAHIKDRWPAIGQTEFNPDIDFWMKVERLEQAQAADANAMSRD